MKLQRSNVRGVVLFYNETRQDGLIDVEGYGLNSGMQYTADDVRCSRWIPQPGDQVVVDVWDPENPNIGLKAKNVRKVRN